MKKINQIFTKRIGNEGHNEKNLGCYLCIGFSLMTQQTMIHLLEAKQINT
jgi:hypothetical protein